MDTHIRKISTQQADDRWHYVGGSGEPAFQNSWVNYGTDSQKACFRKDSEGWVHVLGLVKNGTLAVAMFTLPEGYRRRRYVRFGGVSNNAFSYLFTNPSGEVIAYNGSGAWVDLAEIVFLAEA